MKRLYLLRHAQAASALDGDDKERPLTPHGIEQAQYVAQHIENVDMALCSSAKRTQMTLDVIEKVSGTVKKTSHMDELYNASAGAMLHTIQNCEEDTLLLVSHNPGIHVFANTLVGQGDDNRCNNLAISYPPGMLCIIDCPCDDWANIQPQENTLVDLIIPE